MNRGIFGIIAGEGKGKTTSAIGLAIRAAGWQQKVLLVQFFKGQQTGESKILAKMEEIDYQQFGSKRLINFKKPKKKDKETFKKAWKYVKDRLAKKYYDLVILDEINLAIYYQLLEESKVLELVKNRKESSIILTGRNGEKLKELVKRADFVSKVEKIKHHFDKNRGARKGIEY